MNNWFKRCSLLGDVPSIKTLREKLAEEEALKVMMPNLHMFVCQFLHVKLRGALVC